MSQRLVALGLVLALVTPVFSQPSIETKSGSVQEPLFVLVTDSEGAWSPEQQARFEPPPALGHASTVSTDWKELVDTRPFKFLSYQKRVALLRYPRRLLASSWAEQYFDARHVLVVNPAEDGRVTGRLFDLRDHRVQTLVVVHETRSGADEARGEALADAADRAEVARSSVVAHPESGLFHHPGAEHLSPRVEYTTVETAQRAEIYGFQACRVCYPGTDRESLYDSIDHRLGVLVAQTVESRYRLAPVGPETERVQNIGNRILKENRFLDQGYQFFVLETETVNAFAAPTGPIYVTTGMLDILESDDELAAILGHELSHSERKHARRQYERSRETGVFGLLVTVATGVPWAQLGSSILSTVMARGYSRASELEADRDGMMMAYAAGYAPEDFLLVQEKLKALSEQKRGGGANWLRTHPRGDKRLKQLREVLDDTRELRAQLDELEKKDIGTARMLKSQVLDLQEGEENLQDYLTLYQELLSHVES